MTKIKINRKDFAKLIGSVAKLVPTKSTLPILEYFKFETDINQLRVIGSDLENVIIRSMVVECEEKSVFCITAKMLQDAVNLLTCDTFELDVDVERNRATLDYGKGRYDMPCANANAYPDMPLCENEVQATFSSLYLFNATKQGRAFIADDRLRPIMNTIYCEFKGGELNFVGTDAHKLYWNKTQFDGSEEFNFTINAKSIGILQDIVNNTLNVNVFISDKYVRYEMDGSILIARQFVGNFPNYRAVVPTNQPITCVLGKKELIEAVKRCMWGADLSSQLTVLKIANNELKISSQDMDFAKGVSETVECEVNGGITIGAKSAFLLTILDNISGDKVHINLSDATRPMIFSDGHSDVIFLLMPLMIN